MTDELKLPPEQPEQDTTTGTTMILTMGIIGLACAVLIVLTYNVTYATIEQNKAEFLERAIFDVLPNTTEKVTYTSDHNELRVLQAGKTADMEYYAGYNDQKELTGIAVPAEGMGFQDVVRILYGYSPECKCIIGMKVLESRETPGLGTKIETDPDFLKNFEALDVRLADNNNEIANPIVLVKPRQKNNPWEIDAISGATISSQAVTDILHDSTAGVIPLIENNLRTLQRD